ncbi:MAG: hypothetical protein ACFFGZ_17035 [Candidatus Thorarchaeota archaeon]
MLSPILKACFQSRIGIRFFSDSQLRNIVETKIKQEEGLGNQVGGSGHLGNVNYELTEISSPKKVPTECGVGWEIAYCYTIIVVTEFTIYPDNPPYERQYRKTIVIDNMGHIIGESPKERVIE